MDDTHFEEGDRNGERRWSRTREGGGIENREVGDTHEWS